MVNPGVKVTYLDGFVCGKVSSTSYCTFTWNR